LNSAFGIVGDPTKAKTIKVFFPDVSVALLFLKLFNYEDKSWLNKRNTYREVTVSFIQPAFIFCMLPEKQQSLFIYCLIMILFCLQRL
jgi:hypothetical protein